MAWTLSRLAKRAPAASGLEEWKLFVDLAESTLRTPASLSLGGYIEFHGDDDEINAELVGLLNKKLALGDWNQVLEATVRAKRYDPFREHLHEQLVRGRAGKKSSAS